MELVKYFTNNTFRESAATDFYEVFNPSTGELIAKSPKITLDEVREVISNAEKVHLHNVPLNKTKLS